VSAFESAKRGLRLPHGSPDLVESGGPARTPVESRGDRKFSVTLMLEWPRTFWMVWIGTPALESRVPVVWRSL
jgi:hypothetical protein